MALADDHTMWSKNVLSVIWILLIDPSRDPGEQCLLLGKRYTFKDAIVSTTGMISRELFEYRTAMNQGHERDFLTVGSMGHASQIALGIAFAKQQDNVSCKDEEITVAQGTTRRIRPCLYMAFL